MNKTESKIVFNEEYIDGCKSYGEKQKRNLLSISDGKFLSTNGYIAIEVPISKIANPENLKFDKDEKFMEDFNYWNQKFNSSENLGQVKISELSDLIITQKSGTYIHNNYRKLKHHECDLVNVFCTIKEGLLLGNDYDHCYKCSDNHEQLFLVARLTESITLERKNNINIESKDDTIKISQYTLSSSENLELIKKLFGDVNVQIEVSKSITRGNVWEQRASYNSRKFGMPEKTEEEVKKDLEKEMKDTLNKIINHPFIKLRYDFDDDTFAQIITVPIKY